MQIGNERHGFLVEDIKLSAETGSTVYFMTHGKTGARLVYLENDDDNKAFGIGFKTPPTDSTGVAHIVEHCVLSGSRKFKTREPFMELLKGSMQTFLNAMTFSDMTIYPIASMNDKDFLNLMDVYLDSVFYPRMFEQKEIFMQEGWHYELLDPSADITIKGVVYNEMRGDYSSPERQVFGDIMRSMHPGSTYAHESGGYPYSIPDLTFENFKAFHQKHYHPANSFLYLYGDLDLDAALGLLNDGYLKDFGRREQATVIQLEDRDPGVRQLDLEYSADESASAEENSYLAYSVCHGTAKDPMDVFMNSLLGGILVNSESSPLKRALLEKGIAEDVFAIDSGNYYLDLGIVAKNSDIRRAGEFVQIVEDTLRQIVRDGFNKNLLLAEINRTEFALREAHGTLKGIIYFINTVSAWRYGEDPLMPLTYNEVFAYLRKNIDTGFFERYVLEKILNAGNKILSTHRPKAGLYTAEDQKLADRLKALKASLSEAEIQALVEETTQLLVFQSTEDSKEDKATIPHLQLSDIKREIHRIPEEAIPVHGSTVYFHDQKTSDITYVTLAFPMDFIQSEADLFLVANLGKLLGISATEHYSYMDLNNEIMKYTSGIRFSPAVFKNSKVRNDYEAKFLVSSSAIGENYQEMFRLILEVINHSNLLDKGRLKEILGMEKSSMEMHFDARGDEVAVSRVKAAFSAPEKVREKLTGLSYYDHLCELIATFDATGDELAGDLNRMMGKLFNQSGLEIFLTGEADAKADLLEAITAMLGEIKQAPQTRHELLLPLGEIKEAVASASNVQYVAKGYNIKDLGYTYSGKLVVLTSLLSKDYLHNQIRAKGGAYGAGISIDRAGDCAAYSYRDPNLENTIGVYQSMGDFLRSGAFDEEDVKNYIIGSMTKFAPPLAPSDINSVMMSRRYSHISEADILLSMNQALEVTKTELIGYADMMDGIMKQNYLCVYGNSEVIQKSSSLFAEIRQLKPVKS